MSAQEEYLGSQHALGQALFPPGALVQDIDRYSASVPRIPPNVPMPLYAFARDSILQPTTRSAMSTKPLVRGPQKKPAACVLTALRAAAVKVPVCDLTLVHSRRMKKNLQDKQASRGIP